MSLTAVPRARPDLQALADAIGEAEGPCPLIDALIMRQLFPTLAARGESWPLTASVDEAASIVFPLLPEFDWCVSQDAGSTRYGAGVSRPGDIGWWDTRAVGATPALALLQSVTIAMIRRGGTRVPVGRTGRDPAQDRAPSADPAPLPRPTQRPAPPPVLLAAPIALADHAALDQALADADGPSSEIDAMITRLFFPGHAARGEIIPATASVERAGAIVRALLPALHWRAGSEQAINSWTGAVWHRGGTMEPVETSGGSPALALLSAMQSAIVELSGMSLWQESDGRAK